MFRPAHVVALACCIALGTPPASPAAIPGTAPTTCGGERAVVFPKNEAAAAALPSYGVCIERQINDAYIVSATVLPTLPDASYAVRVLPDPYLVELGSTTFDVRTAPITVPPQGQTIAVVAVLDVVPDPSWVDELTEGGATWVGTIPPAGYLLRADAAAINALQANPNVLALTAYQPDWKIAPRAYGFTPQLTGDGAEYSLPPGSDVGSPPDPPGASSLLVAPGKSSSTVTVEIGTFSGTATGAVTTTVSAAGGSVLGIRTLLGRTIVHASLPSAGVDTIAQLEEVEFIDAEPYFPDAYNERTRVVMQTERTYQNANVAFYNPIYGLGIYGESQLIAMADTGLRQTHEVFEGKIAPGNYMLSGPCATVGDPDSHGTGVAGTLLGDARGMVSGQLGTPNDYDGVSLQSTLLVQDMDSDAPDSLCPPNDPVNSLFQVAFDRGARVHNNSWGHGISSMNPMGGRYSMRSQAIDQWLNDPSHEESVLVFAAGNTGGEWRWSWSYGGYWYIHYFERSLSDEAHSKNAITVGGSRNGNARGSMYLFSSHGPTNDCGTGTCTTAGRIKPDLLAPAVETHSADQGADDLYYFTYWGTSFAAPAVAGAAALVRDYFDQDLYADIPAHPPIVGPITSELVKAMLVNSSVFLSDGSAYAGNTLAGLTPEAYPNFTQGYGRPALDTVLEPAGYRKLKVYKDDTPNTGTAVVSGEMWYRQVKFKDLWQASCNVLRVTLAWNDPAGAIGAGPVLVNDLDLEVTYKGTVYRGNHGLTGGTVFDRLNNVEDVFVPLDIPGNSKIWPEVRVYGASVSSADPQSFSVVVTYGPCFDNTPCPQVGGCYAGPGDIVPGPYPPPPGCPGQNYSTGECTGCGQSPWPSCSPPSPPNVRPIGIEIGPALPIQP